MNERDSVVFLDVDNQNGAIQIRRDDEAHGVARSKVSSDVEYVMVDESGNVIEEVIESKSGSRSEKTIVIEDNNKRAVQEITVILEKKIGANGKVLYDASNSKILNQENVSIKNLDEMLVEIHKNSEEVIYETSGVYCPFETEEECMVWFKKPHVRESVLPIFRTTTDQQIEDLIALIRSGEEITSDTPEAQFLVDRYKLLAKNSQSCCSDGMVDQLQRAGASEDLIYKFLVDDANFYQLGQRCLFVNDLDLNEKFPNTATSIMVADVRNTCLCQQKQKFKDILGDFVTIYNEEPEFGRQPFEYTYRDGLGRTMKVSIMRDITNIIKQIEACP